MATSLETAGNRIYYGAVVNPISLRAFDAFPQALIAVSSDGSIVWLEPDVDNSLIQQVIEGHGWLDAELIRLQQWEWIMPGFVDTHTHAPQFLNIGIGQQHELLDWLTHVTFPTESKFEDPMYARDVYPRVVQATIASGTTTCCYYGTHHLEATKILADVTYQMGQRAFVGKCNMNQNSPSYYIEQSPEQSISDTKALIAYIKTLGTELVHPILTPRFAISCTSQLLSGLGQLAQEDPHLAIQTHISEHIAEIELTKQLFPQCKSYADVYDSHALLRHNTILAHVVHPEEDEITLIKERDAGVSHCPTSNLNLSSGCTDIGKLLDRGIKVGLGTDCSGGYSPSILTAMQHASIVSKLVTSRAVSKPIPASNFAGKPLPVSSLLYLATIGGAQLCNLEHVIGSFAPGKSFDALLINTASSRGIPGMSVVASDGENGWTKQSLEERLEKFMFCGDDRNILKVWVRGREIGGFMAKEFLLQQK